MYFTLDELRIIEDALDIKLDQLRDMGVDFVEAEEDVLQQIRDEITEREEQYRECQDEDEDDGQPSWEKEWEDFGECYDDGPGDMI